MKKRGYILKGYTYEYKRNYLIDNLKVILIFLVVLGHTIEYYINQNYILRGIYVYIYIFHMPLFIYISGYLSKKNLKSVNGIIKKLILPYLFFNTMWYICVYLVTGENMFSIFYPGWTLWYLISLFFWRVSVIYITKIKFIIPISFIVGLLIGLDKTGENFLSLSRTIVFLPFFLMGYYTKEKFLKNISSINKGIGIIIIGIFLLISMYIAKEQIVNYKFLYNSHGYSSNNLSIYNGILFRFILYILSIILSIGVIILTPSRKVFYSKFGKNTMNVYLFHIYLVAIVLGIVPKWNISFLHNLIVITSPFFIMFLLSQNFVKIVYNYIFIPINYIFDLILRIIKNIYFKIIKI